MTLSQALAPASVNSLRYILPLLALLLLLPCRSLAEEMDIAEALLPPADLPEAVPPLPDVGEAESAYIIDQNNVALFHDVLLAPLASWIKDGWYIVHVYRQLAVPWELSYSWYRSSKLNARKLEVDNSRNLVIPEGTEMKRGLPFGNAFDINSETDPEKKAYKILWNLAFTEGAARDVFYGLDIAWIGYQSVHRKSSGIFYREIILPHRAAEDAPDAAHQSKDQGDAGVLDETPAPDALEPAPTVALAPEEPVFRRTLLKLLSPSVVFGFAEISHRYLASEEDKLWIYSPVLGRSRRLLESNRSDPLLDSAISYDDLFVWSTKVQSVNARFLEEKTLLVPFATMVPLSGEYENVLESTDAMLRPQPTRRVFPRRPGEPLDSPEPAEFERILTVRGPFQSVDGTGRMTQWNYETREVPSAAGWVPLKARFIPRRVWIVEVSPRDPYYLAGRQIVIVDQETMLPVYKLVYDRKGQYQKLIMGGWSVARGENDKTRFPYLGFMLAVEAGSNTATAITTQYVRTFRGKDSKVRDATRKLLSIKEHEQQAEAGEAEAGADSVGEQLPEKTAVPETPTPETPTLETPLPEAPAPAPIEEEGLPTD